MLIADIPAIDLIPIGTRACCMLIEGDPAPLLSALIAAAGEALDNDRLSIRLDPFPDKEVTWLFWAEKPAAPAPSPPHPKG